MSDLKRIGAPVVFDVRDGVATLVLNNAARKNAITLEMASLIEQFCCRVDEDQSVGAVVVSATGTYFCSGADTRDLASSSSDPASSEAVARTSAVYGAFLRVGALAVPSVSVVVGGAVGAGMNLALATDLMLVTPNAVLDSGFPARHIHPGGGHLALLGRTAGRRPRWQWECSGLPCPAPRPSVVVWRGTTATRRTCRRWPGAWSQCLRATPRSPGG